MAMEEGVAAAVGKAIPKWAGRAVEKALSGLLEARPLRADGPARPNRRARRAGRG